MNKKSIFIFLLISLIIGVISYIVLDNVFIALGVFVFYVIFSVFLICPMLKKYDLQIKRHKECYQFENSFIIALSIKQSISLALESTLTSMSEEFMEQYNSLGNMSDKEKLEYLSTYFDSVDYQVFLEVINSWTEKGGDALLMSKYLTSNLRNSEDSIEKYDQLNRKKYSEFAVLWSLCFLILVFMKYCLKDFYSQIKGKTTFIVSFIVLCLFALLSIFLLVWRGTQFLVRRYQKDEKVI